MRKKNNRLLRRRYLAEAIKLSLTELAEETLSLAMGDDWDGMFTETGRIEYSVYRSYLMHRLRIMEKMQNEKN